MGRNSLYGSNITSRSVVTQCKTWLAITPTPTFTLFSLEMLCAYTCEDIQYIANKSPPLCLWLAYKSHHFINRPQKCELVWDDMRYLAYVAAINARMIYYNIFNLYYVVTCLNQPTAISLYPMSETKCVEKWGVKNSCDFPMLTLQSWIHVRRHKSGTDPEFKVPLTWM